MLTNAILLGASLSGLASAAVFTVSVGAGGALAFQPSTTTAQIGDTVEFHFSNVLHSVAQSSANAPCTYNSTGFFSTEQRNTNSVFTVSITDKEPKYFFCSVGSHCSSGMVGIINP
jgi:plastocyanin